ncbi:MAG TPA: glutathione S-transferase N-terminal domain-containing protein [Micropepsaceae bacterium]|nr:glutathione S-transferase N-terminal domain-containing protein [Micropepsaceae bacterium]
MTMSKPITLYSWTTPNGVKPIIMVEECGLDYEIKWIDITNGDQKKPEFLAVSPNNKIPAITDPDGPDGKPVSIFESGAILQYLGRKTGKFYPQQERQRIEVEEWLFWQVGGLGPMGGQAHHYLRFAKEKIPYAMDRFREEMYRLYTVMGRRLKDREYLAGEYSIADIACFGWASRWDWQGQKIEDFPNVKTWLDRVGARPAVQRGMSKKPG